MMKRSTCMLAVLAGILLAAPSPATAQSPPLSDPSFAPAALDTICADVNYDGAINIADVIYLIDGVFKCGPAPQPICIGDANGDGGYNIGDAIYVLAFIFRGGLPPVPCCTEGSAAVVIDRAVKCGN